MHRIGHDYFTFKHLKKKTINLNRRAVQFCDHKVRQNEKITTINGNCDRLVVYGDDKNVSNLKRQQQYPTVFNLKQHVYASVQFGI